MAQTITIPSLRHPQYIYNLPDWSKWRYIWEGGDAFIRTYLEKWSERENDDDFDKRRNITPVPGFAKAALVDIKNSIFSRMVDIIRRGGSQAYESAINGYKGGVDRHGSSMNHFIGTQILPEMLAMGQVGIYVDNIAPAGPTLADAENAAPYLYQYRVEDILSWRSSLPHQESDYQAILLRDWCINYNVHYGNVFLPSTSFERFRLVWVDPNDGYVRYQFFDSAGKPIDQNGEAWLFEPQRLELRKIPFVLCSVGDSLLKDIANHQIALLNLVSSDVSYALKANFPFYTEQQDARAMGSHIKSDIMEDGTSSSGGQAAGDKQIRVGAVDGRYYDIKAERPGFIHPSSEPLRASIELQRKLEEDIRKLVNLAVISLGSNRASAESRNIDNQGLEAGLAFIGLVLETAERKIADHWAAYEGKNSSDTVVIKYPEQYSLKSMGDRITEADKLTGLMFSIPSTTAKKELAKDATASLMGGRITPDLLAKINKEIDTANYSTSSPDVVRLAKEEGLASDVTLSNALGFDGEIEVPKANKDHAKRVARIQQAQAPPIENAGARGVKDMETNPKDAVEERDEATDTTLNDTTKKPIRGKGK